MSLIKMILRIHENGFLTPVEKHRNLLSGDYQVIKNLLKSNHLISRELGELGSNFCDGFLNFAHPRTYRN